MRAFGLVGALTVILLLAGCGDEKKQAVDRYVDSVNAIQNDMRLPLARVEFAYRNFGVRGITAKRERGRLRGAVQSLEELHRRLAALDAPRPAAQLDRDLVRLTALEASFAREVWMYASYVPRYRAVLAPIAAANAEFQAALRHSHRPEAQIAALRMYRRRVVPLSAELRRLRPPPLLLPLHTRQLASLRRLGVVALQLARALDRQDGAGVARGLSEFEQASIATRTVAAQRAQISAVRAYNSRLSVIRRLADRIRREQTVLNEGLD